MIHNDSPEVELLDFVMIEQSPDIAESAARIYERTMGLLATRSPGMYLHPLVGEDGVVYQWCVHQDDSGHGCRRPGLLETVVHVLEEHDSPWQNCGQ